MQICLTTFKAAILLHELAVSSSGDDSEGVRTFRPMPFQPLQFQPLQFQPQQLPPFTLSTVHTFNRVPFQPRAISTTCNFNREPFQPPQIQPLQLSSNQLITVTKCNHD